MSTAQDKAIYRADVTFTVSKAVPLAVWSGMFLYRELLRSFEQSNIYFDHDKPKPFTISPIFNASSDSFINSGILSPGDVYKFRFSTIDRALFESFRGAVCEGGEVLKVVRLESSYVRPSVTLTKFKGEEFMILVKVRFAPTIFKFRSFDILYPSPQRLIMSALRDLYLLTGLDLRRQAVKVLTGLELISHSTKTFNLHIGAGREGKPRYVRAFWGDATYALTSASSYPRLFYTLLSVAQSLGVGKNRAMGLGDVRVIDVSAKSVSTKGNSPKAI